MSWACGFLKARIIKRTGLFLKVVRAKIIYDYVTHKAKYAIEVDGTQSAYLSFGLVLQGLKRRRK